MGGDFMPDQDEKKKKSFNIPVKLAYQLEDTAKAQDTNETSVLVGILQQYFQNTEEEQTDVKVVVDKERVTAEIAFMRLLVSESSSLDALFCQRFRKELDRLCDMMKMQS